MFATTWNTCPQALAAVVTLQQQCARTSERYAAEPWLAAAVASAAKGDGVLVPKGEIDVHAAVRTEPPTYFHALAVADVPLRELILHLYQCFPTCITPGVIAASVALFRRFERATELPATALSMHRLLATCVLVAAKAVSDRFISNVALSKTLSIDPLEMARMEVSLLVAIDWRCQVTAEDCQEAMEELARREPATPALDSALMPSFSVSLSATAADGSRRASCHCGGESTTAAVPPHERSVLGDSRADGSASNAVLAASASQAFMPLGTPAGSTTHYYD